MKNKRKKGFTLIELIATMAIFTILVAVTFSLITTLFKYNSINKTTFDANSNSRAFFELIRNNRPNTSATPARTYPAPIVAVTPPELPKQPAEKWCYLYFNDKTELETLVKDKFVQGKNTDSSAHYYYFDTANKLNNFSDVKSKDSSKKYCIEVRVYNNLLEGVYELETRSWDMEKGNTSLVSRKSLIARN